MFGVVPKTLWERRLAADGKNRIPLGMRCLLVEDGDRLTLIDTGIGGKQEGRHARSVGGPCYSAARAATISAFSRKLNVLPHCVQMWFPVRSPKSYSLAKAG